jgi:hypothetical protein
MSERADSSRSIAGFNGFVLWFMSGRSAVLMIADVIVQSCAGPPAQELHRIALPSAINGAIEPLIQISHVLV